MDLITRRTADVMGMDSCSIYLLDNSHESLVLKATSGLAAGAVGRARLQVGEGPTGSGDPPPEVSLQKRFFLQVLGTVIFFAFSR